MAVRSVQDTYATHVSSSRGYPLWTPEQSVQLLSHRPGGLRIGDVGVVVPDNGSFDVFFNLCQSKDDPFNKDRVPDGFRQVELTEADIATVLSAESPRQVLTASAVARVGSDGVAGATGYNFNLSSNEGALLVLPEGADRHDVRDVRPFLEQASQHAAAWYRFAETTLGQIISHDSIYVITGLHKARSWEVASYHHERGNSGDFSARLVGASLAEGDDAGAAARYRFRWGAPRNMDWRTGPSDGLGLPNQAVFIRGFKIALRNDVQGNLRVKRKPDENLGTRVEITDLPEILPVFHPSDIINRYILQKEPNATVAITHDRDWGSILDENLLKPEELVREELLLKAVSKRYTIVSQDGVAHLEPKRNGPGHSVDGITNGSPAVVLAGQASITATHNKIANVTALPSHPESFNVVSESTYRCIGEGSTSESCSVGLQSIPSKFMASPRVGAPTAPESHRLIKIILISDYLCGFCYICAKVLHNAIKDCQNQGLPVRFDMEYRPFTLVTPAALAAAFPNQVVYRNAYLIRKYGKEQTMAKMRAIDEFAPTVDLKLTEDSIVCETMQAHRLSTKAYQVGGQDLQNELSTCIFDGCLSQNKDISDEDFLVDVAVRVGLMKNKEEATKFLHSTECLDCVEKMVEAARANGINGVPFVIIDGKLAVNGLQPVECFTQIFRKLAQLPLPSTTATAKSVPKTENPVKACVD